jgi:hypothetical protein
MRDDNDDTLAGYDLSAWEAPAPAAGLAEAVVARVTQPAPVGAMDPGERPVRRWWIAGAIGAVAAAGVAFSAWGIRRAPANGEGDVVATTAKHVELGPSTAELDPGTQIHWRRDKHRVAIAQARGAATWRVGGDDTMVIDAGATMASVEATGASLRVEVKMNLSDARVIGASAVTAAVVAMVTVIVYEGHVKVTSGRQTVNVVPGTAFEVRPPVPARDPIAVGGAVPDSLDRLAFQTAITAARNQLEACTPMRSAGQAEARVEVAPDGSVRKVTVDGPLDAANTCMENVLAGTTFPATKSGGSFTYPIVWAATTPSPPQPPTASCDAEALREKGHEQLINGADAAALASFEASIACAPAPALEKLAYFAACNAKNRAKATQYYARIPAAQQSNMLQICVRNGVDPTVPPPPSSPPLRPARSACQLPGMVDPFDNRPVCAATGTGSLRVMSTPAAKVLVDNVAIGATPLTAQLAPGTHRVTFMIGGDKYTFSVVVKDGETVTLSKDLR